MAVQNLKFLVKGKVRYIWPSGNKNSQMTNFPFIFNAGRGYLVVAVFFVFVVFLLAPELLLVLALSLSLPDT